MQHQYDCRNDNVRQACLVSVAAHVLRAGIEIRELRGNGATDATSAAAFALGARCAGCERLVIFVRAGVRAAAARGAALRAVRAARGRAVAAFPARALAFALPRACLACLVVGNRTPARNVRRRLRFAARATDLVRVRFVKVHARDVAGVKPHQTCVGVHHVARVAACRQTRKIVVFDGSEDVGENAQATGCRLNVVAFSFASFAQDGAE